MDDVGCGRAYKNRFTLRLDLPCARTTSVLFQVMPVPNLLGVSETLEKTVKERGGGEKSFSWYGKC